MMDYLTLVDEWLAIEDGSTKEEKTNIVKLMDNYDIDFTEAFDSARPFDDNEFVVEILHKDKLVKALKTLKGETEMFTDRIEYFNNSTDEFYVFYFDELEFSQEQKADKEALEQMRINSYYW